MRNRNSALAANSLKIVFENILELFRGTGSDTASRTSQEVIELVSERNQRHRSREIKMGLCLP
jgi:hypothetical protein